MTQERCLPRSFWGGDNCRWWQWPRMSRLLLLSPGKGERARQRSDESPDNYTLPPLACQAPKTMTSSTLYNSFFALCPFISSLLQSTTKKGHRSGYVTNFSGPCQQQNVITKNYYFKQFLFWQQTAHLHVLFIACNLLSACFVPHASKSHNLAINWKWQDFCIINYHNTTLHKNPLKNPKAAWCYTSWCNNYGLVGIRQS